MRRILRITTPLLLLTVIGTVVLRRVEGASWLDSLYMVVITLSTVGYTEHVSLSEAGQLFMIGYIICGFGIFTYSAFQLGQWIVSAQILAIREQRRMKREVNQLQNHYIVCGQGRMGTAICEYLQQRNKPFVVIDTDSERLALDSEERGWLYVAGDATDDEVLQSARIEHAVSLASVLPTDADNVYVVLSARMLNSKLQIIARASDQNAVVKLQRAGATRIVSPFSSGAVKMARFMLNPSVEDFLEIADTHGNDLQLADLQISDDSPYVGRSLMDTDLARKGVMVIGIRRSNGERLMPPPGDAVIESGDALFAFGSAEAINQLIGEAGK